MLWDFLPDAVIEEKVRIGLTNELIYDEHLEIFRACQKKAYALSDRLTPAERRFISNLKANSILLPFSKASATKKHLKRGDMVTLLQLLDVIKFLKEQGLEKCIGCDSLKIEMEKDEDGKLIIHAGSHDLEACSNCSSVRALPGTRRCLPKPL